MEFSAVIADGGQYLGLQWIELAYPETRETGLLQLSESVPDLAPMLWYSFETTAATLKIFNIYLSVNPAALAAHQSNWVCMSWPCCSVWLPVRKRHGSVLQTNEVAR